MAKSTKQKARKEYKCNKCGAVINKGDEYYKIEAMYQSTKYRCCKCKPQRSELTSSEYLSWLYDLQDNLTERYDLRSESAKDELYSEIESQKDELEDRLNNMPEQLQYAPTGETLQERIDSLDSALDDLDNLEYPDEEEYRLDDDEKEDLSEEEIEEQENEKFQDALDDYESELENIISSIE